MSMAMKAKRNFKIISWCICICRPIDKNSFQVRTGGIRYSTCYAKNAKGRIRITAKNQNYLVMEPIWAWESITWYQWVCIYCVHRKSNEKKTKKLKQRERVQAHRSCNFESINSTLFFSRDVYHWMIDGLVHFSARSTIFKWPLLKNKNFQIRWQNM